MRCSESQTTCTEAELRQRASGVVEALIFANVLEPLTKTLGPVGELALSAAAQKIFAPKDG